MNPEYEIRGLTQAHLEPMWRVNEEGLPGVGKVSPEQLQALLELSVFSRGVFRADSLLGFVICLLPNTSYTSLNYGWFNARYDTFLYVDRVAVSEASRNQGVGSALYEAVYQQARREGLPVAAEVNLSPPNPGSMRFHLRHGFEEVGVLEHPTYTVSMLLKSESPTNL